FLNGDAGDPAGTDLAAVRNELAQNRSFLVVNLAFEGSPLYRLDLLDDWLTGASLRHILLLDRTRALLSAAARGGCYLERGIGAKALAPATPRVVTIGAGPAAALAPPLATATPLAAA